MIGDTIFYVFAFCIVFFSVLVVTVKNILHAALALIASFFLTAGLYILLHAEFVAVAQIMVYIGGVVIFIVFTILLTTQLGEKFLAPHFFNKGLAGLIIIQLAIFFFYLYRKLPGAEMISGQKVAGLEDIGLRFLDVGPKGFIVPFEIISILLLAALIGAVTIARREKSDLQKEVDLP